MGQRPIGERTRIWLAWLIVLTPGVANCVDEAGGYYDRKEEGWFWKEFIPAEELPLEAEVPVIAAPQVEPKFPVPDRMQAPEPLSPAWMRESLPRYLDRALADPTPENVRAYFLLQRYAMDTAERFAAVAQRVVMSDPALDANARRPISTYGAEVSDKVAEEATLAMAKRIAEEAGVWYFYRSDCPFCKAQNPVLARLASKIGLTVLPIALDAAPMADGVFPTYVADRGHAEQLGVESTPTLFLVRGSDGFAMLSEGLVTEENLIQRIVSAAHQAGWISEEEFNSTRPVRPSTLTVEDRSTLDRLVVDPALINEALKLSYPAGR